MRTMNDYPRLLCMTIVAVCIMFVNACGDDTKDDPVKIPVLTTAEASAITSGAATVGGNITSDGGSEVTARGICWSTAVNPTIDGSKTTDGKGMGSFTGSLTGLTPNTKYYVRAYATNSAGTAYGNEVNFTTAAPESGTVAPTLTTDEVSSIAATTATAGGNITNAGTPAYTERGVCYAITENPTAAASKVLVAGSGTGTFTANLTGLTAGTKYYVRAYAVNSVGTVYGNEVNFTTSTAEGPIDADSELLLVAVYEHYGITTTLNGKFEYDSQGRITKITDNDPIHYENITYDASGGLTIQGVDYDGPFQYTYAKVGNTIVASDGDEEMGVLFLNDQELPNGIQGDVASFTWDSKGNLLTATGFFNDGTNTYTYDNKKGPLSSCTSPKWYLWLMSAGEPARGGYVNNPLTENSIYGNITWIYEYNVAGYPTRVSSPGDDNYYTFTYRKK